MQPLRALSCLLLSAMAACADDPGAPPDADAAPNETDVTAPPAADSGCEAAADCSPAAPQVDGGPPPLFCQTHMACGPGMYCTGYSCERVETGCESDDDCGGCPCLFDGAEGLGAYCLWDCVPDDAEDAGADGGAVDSGALDLGG